MEASDGEEEKTQKGSEEKEEVDSPRRPARPQETRSRNAGRGIGRESCGETGSAKTETVVRLPSVAVAPGAGPAPNPRSSLAVYALGAGCEWTAVGPGLALRTEPQTFSAGHFFSFSRKCFRNFATFGLTTKAQ